MTRSCPTCPFGNQLKSAIISVQDSGDGIKMSDREKVFQPFYTTNESGSGLGLGISKNNVLAHGGSISRSKIVRWAERRSSLSYP